jgi:hypothetical protein
MAIRTTNNDENVVIIDLLEILSPKMNNNNNNNNNNRLGLGVELVRLEFDAIMKPSFENDSIIKIGQGLLQDIKELQQSYPFMTSFHNVNGILDTATLMRHLHPEVLTNLSLKKIVALYLHFMLVKSQQLSDWGRRPLQEKQITYAACDCLVLLRLYDAMICEAEEKCDDNDQFDIKNILVHYNNNNGLTNDNNKKTNKKKRRASDNSTNANHIFGKAIQCTIVESTGVHTHFDDNNNNNNTSHNEDNQKVDDTHDDDSNNKITQDNKKKKRKKRNNNNNNNNNNQIWKPLHSRTVMIIGTTISKR